MRPIWKGSIAFGLVNIPIVLYPATRREELRFHLLRESDHSPINYKRVAEADGKEVPWDKIVKGYEYEKGKFVVLRPEDFQRVDVEAAQSVVIQSFAAVEEVSPLLFHKPYFMEPQKGADRAYALLRDALEATGKIGIATVVIKTRQHLAAVKPHEDGLMLELMHFPEELVELSEFRTPGSLKTGKRELDMAKSLIGGMTAKWDPEEWKDDYTEGLEKVIEQKIRSGGKKAGAAPRPRKATKVIDLLEVLRESVRQSSSARPPSGTKEKSATRKKSPEKAAPAAKKKAPARRPAAKRKAG